MFSTTGGSESAGWLALGWRGVLWSETVKLGWIVGDCQGQRGDTEDSDSLWGHQGMVPVMSHDVAFTCLGV